MDWRTLLLGLAGLPYGGEAVDQLAHARQCAGQAVEAGADDELVVAALLHDIGRAGPVATRFPRLPHERAGGRFCADMFPPRVAWLIAAHVPAKRYLVATDPVYREALSPTSNRSLEVQGGSMGPEELDTFANHPGAKHAVALRRWDEAAKDPGAEAPALDQLLGYVDRVERVIGTRRVDR